MKKEQRKNYIDRSQQYREEAQARLEAELTAYQDAGCILRLEGKRVFPKRAAASCFRENGGYMRDIVCDENAMVREINFVRLRKEKM